MTQFHLEVDSNFDKSLEDEEATNIYVARMGRGT